MNDHHFSIDSILGSLPYVVPIAAIENQRNGMHLALIRGVYVDLLRALLRISAYRKAAAHLAYFATLSEPSTDQCAVSGFEFYV